MTFLRGKMRRAWSRRARYTPRHRHSGRIGIALGLSRSEQMARIRPRDTKPEILLRQALWGDGLRYRIGIRTPAGRPDLVFTSARLAVYVDGCQWHGCPLHYVAPRTRTDFWGQKLRINVERDQRQTAELEHLGWRVVRLWEHEIFENLPDVVARVKSALSGEGCHTDSQDWRVVHVEPLHSNLERRRLQSLRSPAQCLDEVRRRTTTKWKRLP